MIYSLYKICNIIKVVVAIIVLGYLGYILYEFAVNIPLFIGKNALFDKVMEISKNIVIAVYAIALIDKASIDLEKYASEKYEDYTIGLILSYSGKIDINQLATKLNLDSASLKDLIIRINKKSKRYKLIISENTVEIQPK